jgi:hypothetical protein
MPSRWKKPATLSTLLLAVGLLAGCAVSSQPTYNYGQRPAELTYAQAPLLSPWQQVEGFFTDPFYWPESLDPAN